MRILEETIIPCNTTMVGFDELGSMAVGCLLLTVTAHIYWQLAESSKQTPHLRIT